MTPQANRIAQKIADLVWEQYSDEFGYKSEKQERNQSISPDAPDSINFYLNQFDANNQRIFCLIATELAADSESPALLELAEYIQGLITKGYI